MHRIIIAPTQAAANVALVFDQPWSHNSSPLNAPTIWAWGLGAAENINIQVPIVAAPDLDDDAHWADAFSSGEQLQLTSVNNLVSLYAISYLRLVKAATAADVGIAVHGWSVRVIGE